jgi:signal transduction histidine kinase
LPIVEGFIHDIRYTSKKTTINFRILKNGKIANLMITCKHQEKIENNERVVLGVVIVITVCKLSEMQLKKYNNELIRSNEDLEQFAYAASHDLQEPLRKIRAFGDRLLTKFSPLLGEQGEDYIHRMQSSSARMQLLIEDLLAFSRISSVERIHELIDPLILINEVKEDLDIQLSSTNSTITLEHIPEFQGDRIQMKRLFQNLISNAVKFQKEHEKPHIKISGETILAGEIGGQLNAEIPSNTPFVQISVKDNGIGFDEKYTKKIFNIFQRLHGRMAYEGTGIGLAICKKIVSNHHGIIEAKSIEGVGSEFIITIPKEYHRTAQTTLVTHEENR